MDQTPGQPGSEPPCVKSAVGEGDVPAALRDALGRAYRTGAPVGLEGLDERVLGASARHLSREVAPRLVLWRRAGLIGGGLAAAAGLALVVLVWKPWGTPGGSPRVAWVSGDLNGDGEVDILDALAISNGLRGGRDVAAGDVNGDGVTDAGDVDALAMRVVSLGGAG